MRELMARVKAQLRRTRIMKEELGRSRAGSCTGLGLSSAKHIIKAHKGKIWAESVEGRGSSFYFTIPLVN